MLEIELFQAYKISYEFIIYVWLAYPGLYGRTLPNIPNTLSWTGANPPSSQGIGNDTFYNICFFQRN